MRLRDLLPDGEGDARIALTEDGASLTYAALHQIADRLARDLVAGGLKRGDCVASLLPNGRAAVVLELACALGGIATVGIPAGARASELGAVLETVAPGAIAHADGHWPADAEDMFGPAIAEGRLRRLSLPPAGGARTPRGRAKAVPGGAGVGGDPVRLFATSGTTHDPKFVVHTQAGVAWHARQTAAALGLGPGDVMLCALPLAGVFGHSALWAILAAGGRAVLVPAFEAHACARAIARHGITCLFGSDVMLRRLLALPDARSLLAPLRWAGFAAFNGPAQDLVAEADALLGLPLFQVYGSSEAQALTAVWSPRDPASVRAVAGGRLVDRDMAMRVRDPSTRLPVAGGATGELELRGRSLFRAYLGNPIATAAAFEDGWYRTGDLACLSPDRGLVFAGRLDDHLRLGGYLIDPREIEEVLASHADVAAAQVVSAAEPGQRDLAVAFVLAVAGGEVVEADLRAWCESRLARHKVPRRFVAVERFPVARGANGDKIQRAVLRAWAREGTRDRGRT